MNLQTFTAFSFVYLSTRFLLITSKADGPDYRKLFACEGNTLEITCEKSTHINVIRANFGRFSLENCNQHGVLDWSVNCKAPFSFRIMTKSCESKQTCVVPANSDYFGDGCPGTLKYLEVHYQCVPDVLRKQTGSSVASPLPPSLLPFSNIAKKYKNDNRIKNETQLINQIVNPQKVEVAKVTTSNPLTIISSTMSTPSFWSSSSPPSSSSSIYEFSFPFSSLPPILSSSQSHLFNNHNKNNKTELNGLLFDFKESNQTKVSSKDILKPTLSDDLVVTKEGLDFNQLCPAEMSRGLFWNWTHLGEIAYQPCPPSSLGLAKWMCSNELGYPAWFKPEADLSGCISNWITNSESRIKRYEEPVINLAYELSELTSTKILFGGDIFPIVDIVNQFINRMESGLSIYRQDKRSSFVMDILKIIESIFSNLLANKQKDAWFDLLPKERAKAANLLLTELSRIIVLFLETASKPDNYILIQDNIYLSLHTQAGDQSEDLIFPKQPFELEADEWTPKNYWLEKNRVFVPKQAANAVSKKGFTRVAFVVYKKLNSLLDPILDSNHNLAKSQSNLTPIVNTDIIGLIVPQQPSLLTHFSQPLRLTFRHLIVENVSSPKCVSWDTSHWSSFGCQLIFTNSTHTKCECNHLAHFAVLMNFNQQVIVFKVSSIPTFVYSGCIISVICLVITLLTFLVFKNYLTSKRHTIHNNLCLCLLVSELVFLFGIDQTQSSGLCFIISALLHYFLLATFLWMLLDGYHVYSMLIEMYEPERHRAHWFTLIGYGVPLIILIVNLLIDFSSYTTTNYCWLKEDMMLKTFVLPVIVAIFTSLTFLSLTFISICKHLPSKPISKFNKQQDHLFRLRSWIRGSFVLTLILALNWSFGVLYLLTESISLAYTFTALNGLQGLVIFVLFCLLNSSVRRKYGKAINRMVRTIFCCSCDGQSSANNDLEGQDEIQNYLFHSLNLTSPFSKPSNCSFNGIEAAEPMISFNCSTLSPSIQRVTPKNGVKYMMTAQSGSYLSNKKEYDTKVMMDGNRIYHQDRLLVNGEHIYECIEDENGMGKMILSNRYQKNLNDACQPPIQGLDYKSLFFTNSTLSAHKSRQSSNEQLPAIIRDNTKSTFISASKASSFKNVQYHKAKDIIARLEGNQVVTCNATEYPSDTRQKHSA